jgi:hypothetical protein
MDDNKKNEQERAKRILLRLTDYHVALSSIYENIVDRDFEDAEITIRNLVMELRFTLKSIKDDDF